MAKAVMIYGQPGSGKGTQAYLLEAVSDYFHFDTGQYIERVIRDPANAKNKIVQREKKLFDSGILCTPSWVLNIVKKKTLELAKAGVSVVFSGSPRTLFEAFGDKKIQGLISVLEKGYGKKNMNVFYLKVAPETSVWRNSHRLVCSTCGAPALYIKGKLPHCAFCGAPFRKRSLDNPKTIKVRIQQYLERTQPILAKLKKMGYQVNAVNGEPAPYKVFQALRKKLER